MKTLEELQAIRDRMKQEISGRNNLGTDIKIVVGMATCGIAAGARPVLNELLSEITKRNLSNVKVSQTGCIGMCRNEPIVEVYIPGKDKITYIKMTADKVGRIVSEHIVNGNPVKDFMMSGEGENK